MARVDIHNLEEWLRMARQSTFRAYPLSQQLKVSPRQLRRYTRELFQKSPQEWLDEQRLILAATRLKEERSVKTVAFQLGFKRLSHFSRSFKLHYGVSPTEFLARSDKRLMGSKFPFNL
jgi:AraC family chitin signaling transcriptional activator